MTGDQNRNRIGAARRADLARVAAEFAGDVAIGARAPARNRLHQAPHALLEVRAGRAQRQIEGVQTAMEIVAKLRRGRSEERRVGKERRLVWGAERERE